MNNQKVIRESSSRFRPIKTSKGVISNYCKFTNISVFVHNKTILSPSSFLISLVFQIKHFFCIFSFSILDQRLSLRNLIGNKASRIGVSRNAPMKVGPDRFKPNKFETWKQSRVAECLHRLKNLGINCVNLRSKALDKVFLHFS